MTYTSSTLPPSRKSDGGEKSIKKMSKDKKQEGGNDRLNPHKVVVFGSGNVGKSSITLQFVTGTFSMDYLPTVMVLSTQPNVTMSLFRSRIAIAKLAMSTKKQHI
jgi:hypothetical protein